MSKPALRTAAAQLYLRVAAVLILGLVVLAAFTWVVANNQAEAHAQAVISATLDTSEYALSQKMEDLAQLGQWMTSEDTLGNLTLAGDREGLKRYLAPMTQADVLDTITIANAQGTVLARQRVDGQESIGDNLADQLSVAESLTGAATSGIDLDRSGHLAARRTLPIYVNGQAQPIGVLVLGLYLDTDLLSYWSESLDAAYILSYQNKIVLSSLGEIQGKPWQAAALPVGALQPDPQGAPGKLTRLATDKGNYLFQFTPLRSPSHTVVAMMGIGVPENRYDKERLAGIEPLGFAFVILLLGMLSVGAFFGRAYVEPLRLLNTATQRIGRGDLATPVVLDSKDELGELAQGLNEMRTRLYEAQDSMQLVESRYAGLVQALPCAVLLTDHENRIISVNKQAGALLELDPAGLIGSSWLDLFLMDQDSDNGLTLSWDVAKSANAAQNLVVRGRFHLRSRPAARFEVASAPVEAPGNPPRFVHILNDVSAAAKVTQTKEDFVLNVGHELRGPLASLRATIDLLAEEYASMNKRDIGLMLRNLQKVTWRFHGLVESLIDVGNVQAGRFRVRPVLISLDKMVRNAIEQTQSIWESKGQRLELDLEADDAMVMADPSRITQVLVNLLINANKYGPEDQCVTLATRREQGAIQVAVTDHGEGIPPEEQARVFERFFRAKRVEEEGAGVGLGLALAKAIVEAHGGEIHLKSSVEQGTTFWFTLPCLEPGRQTPLPSYLSKEPVVRENPAS